MQDDQLSSCHQGFTIWEPYGWCHLFYTPAYSFFLANYQLSCMFTLKEFKIYGRLSDLPTQYQMSDHPLRVLIGVTFCWVDGNYVTFDSAVIMEYFIDDHCCLQKDKKKEEQLKVSLSGRNKSFYQSVCLSNKLFQINSSLELTLMTPVCKRTSRCFHGEKRLSILASALDAFRNDECFS